MRYYSQEIKNMIEDKEHINEKVICLHSLADLSHTCPATFVYLLKECYVYGTQKAAEKFEVLIEQVSGALQNGPLPGPFTFIVQCLYVLPLLGCLYAGGFSQLLIHSLTKFRSQQLELEDFSKAKCLASKLVLDILDGVVTHHERILVKLLEAFDIQLKDLGDAICCSVLGNNSALGNEGLDMAKTYLEQHISGFIESDSYLTAVSLLERSSIHIPEESFLLEMVQKKQFKAANKWANFVGKPLICILVRKYADMNMLKNAYNMMKKHDLLHEFSDIHHLYKESLLKNLAENGLWDIAERNTNGDRQLLEFLVYLALEAGFSEKVDELCARYSLEGFAKVSVDASFVEDQPQINYLDINKLSIKDIIWIDEINGLKTATEYIEGCKIVGVDSEWKPTYERAKSSYKVSIVQIASENRAYIFDLLKLHEDEPKALDSCFRRIFWSSNTLKLGYNLICDLNQLSNSYGDLECFRSYEMLLDIQKLFEEKIGGLSGLAEITLGAGLDKTCRNSNWEQRPLSRHQIVYAAIDAVVLVHIFRKVSGHFSANTVDQCNVEWKSHIVSRMSNT